MAKCFDDSLIYQRKTCDKSTKALSLTAIQMLPRRQNLAVADNRGTLRIFQIGNESATLLSTYKLQRSPELVGEQSQAVTSIYFTQNEQVAVITYESGLISAYDIKGGFAWLGDIEKGVTGFNQASTSASLSRVFERADPVPHDDQSGLLQFPFSGASQANSSYETKFCVFSVRAPNCVRLQLVEVKDNRMNMSPLAQFFINDGKVAGFDYHPSKDYVLITSSKGKIYLFRIDTGELRGTINVPLHAQGCLIDPSGLYVVVQVPPYSPRHTRNLTNAGDGSNLGHLGTNERDLCRTTVLMYEIGTGNAAAEVHSIFDITEMQFSTDGRYLALGSRKGSVSVWALGEHLYQHVSEVIG